MEKEKVQVTGKTLLEGISWQCECGKWNRWANEFCWKCTGARDPDCIK